jgi:hypothetical protein
VTERLKLSSADGQPDELPNLSFGVIAADEGARGPRAGRPSIKSGGSENARVGHILVNRKDSQSPDDRPVAVGARSRAVATLAHNEIQPIAGLYGGGRRPPGDALDRIQLGTDECDPVMRGD